MGPTLGPPGSCRPQVGPMLAPWTLLSGMLFSNRHWPRHFVGGRLASHSHIKFVNVSQSIILMACSSLNFSDCSPLQYIPERPQLIWLTLWKLEVITILHFYDYPIADGILHACLNRRIGRFGWWDNSRKFYTTASGKFIKIFDNFHANLVTV